MARPPLTHPTPSTFKLLMVRYGADYPNPGEEAKNHGSPAPNAPYWRGKLKIV
ncbi:MAG: hypothetical protein F6K50_00975 [Moorea sp. SIO3I7]|uniref:hypothetical protein n=1 Tax=Moorena sp. SIO3I8 TaxID=2607833 RepID=UPI0013BF3E99|nr:hypothetical protein [Moorena sp. SIO3I8]NEN94174.1 hypothetical protein [Moorena sp. SIO3I7]NEO10366.1 hypothetical protein [Moorena sp. SIO3I8]